MKFSERNKIILLVCIFIAEITQLVLRSFHSLISIKTSIQMHTPNFHWIWHALKLTLAAAAESSVSIGQYFFLIHLFNWPLLNNIVVHCDRFLMAFCSFFLLCIWKGRQVLKVGRTYHLLYKTQKQAVLGPEILSANSRYFVTCAKTVTEI